MIGKWTRLVLTVCLLTVANCHAGDEQTKKQTATGVLAYFPENIQSREAWYGHNFMVENTPIQPATISKEKLLKYVGKKVKITGTWNKGIEFKNDAQQILPMPMDAVSNKPVMRGDGINAEKLELLDK